MGNLAADTAIEKVGDGRFRASLSKDWEVWGPHGGYLAAIALRAAGACTGLPRPGSLSCHYLGTAAFDDVDIDVTTQRDTASAQSLRVSLRQRGQPVLEALVWAVRAGGNGPDRNWQQAAGFPAPHEVPLLPNPAGWSVPFWQNLEIRPFLGESPRESMVRGWSRFRPDATFAHDRWLDACRAVIMIDCIQLPAVLRGLRRRRIAAPSLDLYVAFHQEASDQEWLWHEARGTAASGGLLGGQAWIWSQDGRLLASGAQQMLSRAS